MLFQRPFQVSFLFIPGQLQTPYVISKLLDCQVYFNVQCLYVTVHVVGLAGNVGLLKWQIAMIILLHCITNILHATIATINRHLSVRHAFIYNFACLSKHKICILITVNLCNLTPLRSNIFFNLHDYLTRFSYHANMKGMQAKSHSVVLQPLVATMSFYSSPTHALGVRLQGEVSL